MKIRTVVEVKLRFSNEIMKWEDRSVAATFEVFNVDYPGKMVFSDSPRVTLSEKVAQIGRERGAVETRWNFVGSDQGHYDVVTNLTLHEENVVAMKIVYEINPKNPNGPMIKKIVPAE